MNRLNIVVVSISLVTLVLTIFILVKISKRNSDQSCDANCQKGIAGQVVSAIGKGSQGCDANCQKGIAGQVVSAIGKGCDANCQKGIAGQVVSDMTPVVKASSCDEDCQNKIACKTLNNIYFTESITGSKDRDISLAIAIGKMQGDINDIAIATLPAGANADTIYPKCESTGKYCDCKGFT